MVCPEKGVEGPEKDALRVRKKTLRVEVSLIRQRVGILHVDYWSSKILQSHTGYMLFAMLKQFLLVTI